MTNRRRNLAILALVAALLTLALMVVLPGTPLSKETKLGLDLQGGVELIYEGQDPKGGEATPQEIEDAIETIRKRTDALGVSEPEIQRSGGSQITVGLPDVDDPERAEQQVGTTAQLQFYDWEPNLIGENGEPVGTSQPIVGVEPQRQPSLYDAVALAARASPRAEDEDVPPSDPDSVERRIDEVRQQSGGDNQKIYEFWDRENDTSAEKYYLFGPGEGAGRAFLAGPDGTCEELLRTFEERAPAPAQRGQRERPAAEGSNCEKQLNALGRFGPPTGSQIFKVPRGIVVLREEEDAMNEGERARPTHQQPHFAFEDDAALSGDEVENPEQNFDQQTNEPIVSFELNDVGKAAFQEVTRQIADRGSDIAAQGGIRPEDATQRFAISLDNELVSRAGVDPTEFGGTGIDPENGAQIEGIGSLEETQDLAENLRIGALPIELDLISKTQVSATLGEQALRQGLAATGVGVALTILFLILFYRALGLIAATALILYGIFLFALIKLIPITLTLPGIAGTILTLAVAADANVVIYERIKEEARAGVSIPRAISAGYTKALKAIIDANVITIGVAFILFMLATAGVKGFAFTLGVGTIVSLFTAVLATSAILGTLARSRFLGRKSALGAGVEEEHVGWRFDFMGNSRWFFSMSGLILVICALGLAGKGINFGIDFESGSRITTPLEQEASVDDVREALDPVGLSDAKIQEVDDPELGDNVIQISTNTLEPNEVEGVQNALDDAFGVRGADFSSTTIGPTFGEQIARTAIIAILASLFLIALYIGLRFEFKYAVPVLIALSHDLLITAGVYALIGEEVTTATVAALLTILGYSLYDTIIVFDRVRENVPRMPRATFSQIVNRSMSEVLTRSLVTSFSTLVPVVALVSFGGETLRDFGVALLIGVASSTYSSIFIAAPVLTEWKERESVYRRRRQIVMDDHDGIVPAYPEVELGDRKVAARRPAREAERVERAAAARATEARAAADRAEAAEKGEPAEPEEPVPAQPQRAATSTTTTARTQIRPDGGDGKSEGEPAAASPRPARKQKQGGGASRKPRKKHGRR